MAKTATAMAEHQVSVVTRLNNTTNRNICGGSTQERRDETNKRMAQRKPNHEGSAVGRKSSVRGGTGCTTNAHGNAVRTRMAAVFKCINAGAARVKRPRNAYANGTRTSRTTSMLLMKQEPRHVVDSGGAEQEPCSNSVVVLLLPLWCRVHVQTVSSAETGAHEITVANKQKNNVDGRVRLVARARGASVSRTSEAKQRHLNAYAWRTQRTEIALQKNRNMLAAMVALSLAAQQRKATSRRRLKPGARQRSAPAQPAAAAVCALCARC